MDQNTELLSEIRDLLRIIAEPTLDKRDQKQRAMLREVVGKGKFAAKAVLLMDGSRSQRVICKEAGIDSGNLSRLVKSLRSQGLVESELDKPKLVNPIPSDFFERSPIPNG
jgi:DNA-binding MarR family transcriptional regulator